MSSSGKGNNGSNLDKKIEDFFKNLQGLKATIESDTLTKVRNEYKSKIEENRKKNQELCDKNSGLDSENQRLKAENEELKKKLTVMLEAEAKRLEQEEKEKECPICFYPRKDEVKTKCGHCFCRECIVKWVGQNHNCPNCRTEIKDSSNLLNEDPYEEWYKNFMIEIEEFQ